MDFSELLPYLATIAFGVVGFYVKSLAATISMLTLSVAELKTEVAVLTATRTKCNCRELEVRVKALEIKV